MQNCIVIGDKNAFLNRGCDLVLFLVSFFEPQKVGLVMRQTFAVVLVIGLVGIAVSDFLSKDFKAFALACLFAITTVLIFLVK